MFRSGEDANVKFRAVDRDVDGACAVLGVTVGEFPQKKIQVIRHQNVNAVKHAILPTQSYSTRCPCQPFRISPAGTTISLFVRLSCSPLKRNVQIPTAFQFNIYTFQNIADFRYSIDCEKLYSRLF